MMVFIDSKSNIDKEALRKYVLDELELQAKRCEGLLSGEDQEKFWNKLHDLIVVNEKNTGAWLNLEKQLTSLPEFIKSWIETTVDSPERMEFFILSKAEEIRSGDKERDYFWAMQIRHDQLVALIRVVSMLITRLEKLIKLPVDEVLEDPVIQGLTEKSVEDQIFLEAQKIHQDRKKQMSVKE